MFATKTEEMTNFGQGVYGFVKAFIRDFLASSYNFLKKRRKIVRDNKAAKELFKEFEKGNFKDNFKSIIADESFQPYRSYAFHFVIKRLCEQEEFKGKLQEQSTNLINLYFRYWDRTSKRFKRTKKDFIEVIGEFGTITQEHNSSFITKPWKVIQKIDCEVPEEIKRDWNEAADDYNNFARAWGDFCKRAKKDFGVSDPFDIEEIYELRLAEKL